MFDSRLYREACRELRAPEEKVEEIVTMSQQNHTKNRRPVRAVLIAAAIWGALRLSGKLPLGDEPASVPPVSDPGQSQLAEPTATPAVTPETADTPETGDFPAAYFVGVLGLILFSSAGLLMLRRI